MKKLIIVRHAKSSWDFPELDDFDRPLNNRGKRNAPEMGKRLDKKGVKIDLIIASPAKRAYTTAKKIADEISFPIKKIVKEPLFYHGSLSNMLSVIQHIDNDNKSLMIFGHNPGLTELSNLLSNSDIYNIPTCGITEIDFNVSSWSEIEKYTGELVSFDYPKKAEVDSL